MNEIEELSKLDYKQLPPLQNVLLDDLHQKVLKHLYLVYLHVEIVFKFMILWIYFLKVQKKREEMLLFIL